MMMKHEYGGDAHAVMEHSAPVDASIQLLAPFLAGSVHVRLKDVSLHAGCHYQLKPIPDLMTYGIHR